MTYPQDVGTSVSHYMSIGGHTCAEVFHQAGQCRAPSARENAKHLQVFQEEGELKWTGSLQGKPLRGGYC